MMSTRYPDDELARFLRGCTTGEEYWAIHPDHSDLLVSNLGRVCRNGRPLSPYPAGKGGYPTVTIKGRHRRVHHLVLETYIGPRPPGQECCHWDGKGWNPTLMNLRWDSAEANRQDARRHRRERKRRLWDQLQWRALEAYAAQHAA